ncbi:MAG: hypothetical protein DDG59_01350 [Anaerolineae bacterium]|jgi:phosphoglycolate phosphatase|nr:MAG: hypothetical protein DDG59_01350 [Anaerolineae bacterium]
MSQPDRFFRKEQIVIFDFDGVLTDTMAEMLRFSDQVCAELGHPRRTTPQDIYGLPRMGFDQLARQLRIPESLIPQYVQKVLQCFDDQPITYSLYKGMREVILELAKDSVLAVVSGNLQRVIRRFLEKHQLAECFWRIEGIDQPGNKREKIQAIRQAISLAHPAYMIGDAVSDILAAREAGAHSIAVTWGHQDRQKLLEAQPDFIADRPQELLKIIRGDSSFRSS